MGTVPNFEMTKHAMAEWKARQQRVMRCAHCGGHGRLGEGCPGCGSRDFWWSEVDEAKPSVPRVTKRNR